uniref:Uncharacterized protein n=1 Tax=Cannabis sativa TaxID=3483 RepID=A0A803R3C7_CANSA
MIQMPTKRRRRKILPPPLQSHYSRENLVVESRLYADVAVAASADLGSVACSCFTVIRQNNNNNNYYF